jgi:hypothetical protein
LIPGVYERGSLTPYVYREKQSHMYTGRSKPRLLQEEAVPDVYRRNQLPGQYRRPPDPFLIPGELTAHVYREK